MSLNYSVIIPTYNEAPRIPALIRQIQTLNPRAQIIVVDANSADQTALIAQKSGAETYLSPLGRGIQCAQGARKAHGDILIFLHADSLLAPDAFSVLDKFFSESDYQIARFRVLFDHPHWLMKFYAWCSQLNTVFTRFGDQGIVVRRSFYKRMDGFREWPLLEDVDFFRRANRLTKIQLLPTTITTSSRSFVKTGLIRRQFYNAIILMRYLLGVSPEKLFKLYYQTLSNPGSK